MSKKLSSKIIIYSSYEQVNVTKQVQEVSPYEISSFDYFHLLKITKLQAIWRAHQIKASKRDRS